MYRILLLTLQSFSCSSSSSYWMTALHSRRRVTCVHISGDNKTNFENFALRRRCLCRPCVFRYDAVEEAGSPPASWDEWIYTIVPLIGWVCDAVQKLQCAVRP